MSKKSNIGQTGIESIRIAGKELAELSVVDRMRARQQVELSEEERIERDITQKYPPYRVANLVSSINEMQQNILRFETAIAKEREDIAEFTTQLALCKQRDKELTAKGYAIK